MRKAFILIAGIVVLGSIGLLSSVEMRRAVGGASDNITGWFWNAYSVSQTSKNGLGWISANCLNDFDNDGYSEYQCDSTKNYGLSVDLGSDGWAGANYIQGCAWSGLYGWICFNGGNGSQYQCNSSSGSSVAGYCTELSQNGVRIINYASNGRTLVHYLSSPALQTNPPSPTWQAPASEQRAMILSLGEGGGLGYKGHIAFPAAIGTSVASTTGDGSLLHGCFGCGKKCSNDLTRTCSVDRDCDFGSGNTGQCRSHCDACLNVSTDAEILENDQNPNPNLLCMDCTECTVGQDRGSCTFNRDKNTCSAASCQAGCVDYTGVVVNEYQSGKYELCGWGYHAFTQTAPTVRGLGWIPFGLIPNSGNPAYIGVESGSVATRGNIYSPVGPPAGSYNASYIIEASGDITNWFSKNQYRYPHSESIPDYLSVDSFGIYQNVLGKLDVKGLLTNVLTGVASGGTNKYGSTIREFASDADLFSAPTSNPLNNQIVYYPDGATITGGEFAYHHTNQNISGAGIIMVDGDLHINGNVTYEASDPASPIRKLWQVPSAVWVVRGDVIIAPDVTTVAGTFVVLGNGNKCPSQLSQDSLGCGRLSTGNSPSSLTMYGAALARQFNFQRKYSGVDKNPSERFVADGRLQANTPPGLNDFAKSVPRFSTGF